LETVVHQTPLFYLALFEEKCVVLRVCHPVIHENDIMGHPMLICGQFYSILRLFVANGNIYLNFLFKLAWMTHIPIGIEQFQFVSLQYRRHHTQVRKEKKIFMTPTTTSIHHVKETHQQGES
jgi:hypothetical protein